MSLCSRCLSRLTKLISSRTSAARTLRTCSSQAQTDDDGDDGSMFKIQPMPDMEYLLDPENIQTIRDNIKFRKGVGDIDLVHSLFQEYVEKPEDPVIMEKLETAALLIPNRSSPDTEHGSGITIVKTHGKMKENYEGKAFKDVCMSQGLLRFTSPIMSSLVYGSRSYFLTGDLARLEKALVRWTLDKLMSKGWSYVCVPDMVPEQLINACGFVTTGKQNQIYKVRPDQGGLCLAGTSEMSMAGLYAGKSMESETPIKLCTYSQCFRSEEAKNRIDKGFYRLHQFTKVEMFGICVPDQSESLLDEITSIQCELFAELGLHYRLIQMHSEELGAAAYKKYDIEAWLYNCRHWGEISSASNCTDFQARRLATNTPSGEFSHTVNGTACAIPRMLMAIVEQNITEDDRIAIPDCLQPYMNLRHLRRNFDVSLLKPIKVRNKFF